jgi:hypothetical protein
MINRYTIFLILVYALIICITIIYNKFNISLESVQNYHHRYIIHETSANPPNGLFCLRACILCGILYANVNSFWQKVQPLISTKIFEDPGYFYETQRCGYITKLTDTTALIALCSTSNINDAYLNLDSKLVDAFPDDPQYGKIHHGYFQRIQKILATILQFLYIHRSIKYIYITGHSMGGAIAGCLGVFLGYYLMDTFMIDVYTFGAPKSCDQLFVNYYESLQNIRIQTFQNVADKVIYKPTNENYIHIGTIHSHTIDTGNDNVNHGIKVYRECLYKLEKTKIIKRPHRFDETLSRYILDWFG